MRRPSQSGAVEGIAYRILGRQNCGLDARTHMNAVGSSMEGWLTSEAQRNMNRRIPAIHVKLTSH